MRVIEIFPLSGESFLMRPNWFVSYSSILKTPAFYLVELFLVIAVGIMILQRFEDAEFVKKLWNIPIVLIAINFWPDLVLGIKGLVDYFNTFLIEQVFTHMEYVGFSFPEWAYSEEFSSKAKNFGDKNLLDRAKVIFDLKFWGETIGNTIISIAHFVSRLSYWILYAFFFIFFFSYAVLGPLVLAKGVLFDGVSAFLELMKELIILFLWQTMTVIILGLLLPEMVAGTNANIGSEANFLFRSFVFALFLFFVPSMTRKFGNHLGSSFIPAGTALAATYLGMGSIGAIGASTGAKLGRIIGSEKVRHAVMTAEHWMGEYTEKRKLRQIEEKKNEIEHRLRQIPEDDSPFSSTHSADVKGTKDKVSSEGIVRYRSDEDEERKEVPPLVKLSQMAGKESRPRRT